MIAVVVPCAVSPRPTPAAKVRLDQLTSNQRAIVLALIQAAQPPQAQAAQAQAAGVGA